MDEEKEKGENLIGLPETIFILMLVGVEEIIEIVILLFTAGAGIIIVVIMNGAMAALIEMYILLRGGKGIMKLVVQPVCAVIDGLTGGLLPGKFIGTAIAIWVINHQAKLEKKLGAVIGEGNVAVIAGGVTGGAKGAVAKTAGGDAAKIAAQKALNEERAAATRHRIAMGKSIARSPIK